MELVNLRRPQLQALLDGRWDEVGDHLGVALSADLFEHHPDLVGLRLRQIDDDPSSEPWCCER